MFIVCVVGWIILWVLNMKVIVFLIMFGLFRFVVEVLLKVVVFGLWLFM